MDALYDTRGIQMSCTGPTFLFYKGVAMTCLFRVARWDELLALMIDRRVAYCTCGTIQQDDLTTSKLLFKLMPCSIDLIVHAEPCV